MSTTPVPIVKLVVTPDDFKNMFGKDLAYMLAGSDNDSNYPNIFLREVQEYLMDWCDEHGFRRVKFNELNNMQLVYFQKAILYQAYYLIGNEEEAKKLESLIQ